MPSGFVQDQNQLQPNFYRVTIDLSGYPTADGDDNGGVTPNSADFFESADLPTSLVKGKQRARGNMRFRNIVNRLTGLTDCQILDVTISETTGDDQATALAFTVKFERDDFISGDKETAIATAVAQGIIDETYANVRVYNGDDQSDNNLLISVTSPVANLSAALSDVSVIKDTDVTLVNA